MDVMNELDIVLQANREKYLSDKQAEDMAIVLTISALYPNAGVTMSNGELYVGMRKMDKASVDWLRDQLNS